MKLRSLFFLMMIGLVPSVRATHIIGGEMIYKHLGNNLYKITLKVYRDCNTGQAPFDDPAYIGVYNSSGVYIDSIKIGNPAISQIQPTLNNPCILTPPNICVEQAIYTINKTLPPVSGGYTLVYQRCCRNATIINILDPQDAGSTYMAQIPDVGTYGYNSSPFFNSFPPITICAGTPLIYDHSATDPDGDQLVYSFCTPYIGADASAPMPHIPTPPPYSTIVWGSSFSVNNQISSSPPMTINASTGLLTANPYAVGQYVVGICVKEYRNGVLLEEHRRDFQFNVTPCDPLVLAKFGSSIGNADTVLACGQYSISFNNTSIGMQHCLWDFGNPNSSSDTTSVVSPSYTYAGVGDYPVTLIVNPGMPCADTLVKMVRIHLPNHTDFSVDTVCASTPTQFTDLSSTLDGVISSWVWEFDDGGIAFTSNPSHIYSEGGVYSVTLVSATNFGCKDTATKSVLVYSLPVPDAKPDTMICDIDSLTLYSEGGVNYAWAPNYNLNNSGIAQPIAQPDLNTTYTVTVTDIHGCVNIDSAIILVVDTVIASAGPDTVICENQPLLLSSSNAVYYQWEPNNLCSTPDQEQTFVHPTLNTTFTVTSFIGSCFDLDTVIVLVKPAPIPEAGDSGTINQGETFFLNGSGGGTYLWTPPYNLSDPTYASPSATPLHTVTYVLTVTNEFGCSANDSVIVNVTHIHELFLPNAFTPNLDGTNDFFVYFTKGIKQIVDFKIFNRWGQVVYSFNESDQTPWEGTAPDGRECAAGVYVYYIHAQTFDEDIIEKKGNITLLR